MPVSQVIQCNKCSLNIYILTHLQVCVARLQISQGIFIKLFTLFEKACHTVYLKLALYSPTALISSSQFDEYSKALKDLSAIISELETVNSGGGNFSAAGNILFNCCWQLHVIHWESP